jgi:hypothetical protein
MNNVTVLSVALVFVLLMKLLLILQFSSQERKCREESFEFWRETGSY